MNYVVSLIAALAYYFHFLKCSHISQQQYYEAKRYLLLINENQTKYDNKKVILISLLMLTQIVFSMFVDDIYLLIPSSVLAVFTLNYVHFNKKKAIKPLVVTSRIKRLSFVSYLLLSIFFYWIISLTSISYLSLFLLLVMILVDLWFDYLFVVFLYVSYPIEYLVRSYYIFKAKRKLNKIKPIIIAITGSYGKTTTKNIIHNILSRKYRVLATKESYNTVMGIIRTINENLNKLHEILILEVGVDKVGGMDKFKKLITPDYVVVTAIGKQHLTTFKNVDNIVKEKTKLIDFMKEEGVAFINVGSPHLKLYQNPSKKIIRYSIKGDSDVLVSDCKYSVNGTSFDFKYLDYSLHFNTSLLGKHMLEDVIAGIIVGIHFKVDLSEIKQAVSYLKSVSHRMELKRLGNWTLIDDSYNSNPEGFKEALEVLKMFPSIRVLITPLLVELSSQRVSVLNDLACKTSKCVDEVVLTSKESSLPFIDGLIENGFNIENIKSFNSFIEGFNYLHSKYQHEKITLLIANDLPDYVL